MEKEEEKEGEAYTDFLFEEFLGGLVGPSWGLLWGPLGVLLGLSRRGAAGIFGKKRGRKRRRRRRGG